MGEGITGFVGFDNYVDVLTSRSFWQSIVVTVIFVVVAVPIQLVLGFLAAWLVNLGAPGTAHFPDHHRLAAVHPRGGDRLPRRDVLHRSGGADRRAARRARHPCSLDVDGLRRHRRRHHSRRLAVDLVHLHHRSRGPRRHPGRPLRRRGSRREEPLAGDVASGRAARMAGDHDRGAAADGRVPEGLRHSLRADVRRPRHQHRRPSAPWTI